MNELMKLDPVYQVKKKRRKSITIYRKNCKGYPQPADLDTKGLEIPTKINYAHVFSYPNVSLDVLNVISSEVNNTHTILSQVVFNYIKNLGIYTVFDGDSYFVPKTRLKESVLDTIFSSVLDSLQTDENTLIVPVSIQCYYGSQWEKVEKPRNALIKDSILTKELKSVKMKEGVLVLDKPQEWFNELLTREKNLRPNRQIEVGVSNFSMKRKSGHAIFMTIRKNTEKGGKPFVCNVYDSNGTKSFNSAYLEPFLKNMFDNSKKIECNVVHMPTINTADTDFIKKNTNMLSIGNEVTIRGYCATLTFMLIMDILCTNNQVYKEGHFERLLNDLQKREDDEKIEEKHKFSTSIYGQHLAFFVVKKCIDHYKKESKKPPWWNRFEHYLGNWKDADNIETNVIKRSVRLGKHKYKNMNEQKEIII